MDQSPSKEKCHPRNLKWERETSGIPFQIENEKKNISVLWQIRMEL